MAHGSGQAQSLLPLWGLAISKDNEDETKKNSGFWKPTSRGIEFAKGKLTVPAVVVVFANMGQGFEGEQIDVRQALGESFDYGELMGRYEDLVEELKGAE